MTIVKKILTGIRVRFHGFWYNEDRSFDVIVTGKPQETISSEIGRHESNPIDKVAADVLNAIQPGHTTHAVQHANALDKADDGFEG